MENGVNKTLEKLKMNEDKDAVFQSAANILMHLFEEDVKAIADILIAQDNYDVDKMCSYINIVISYLEVCRTNLKRYGNDNTEDAGS